MTIAHHLSQNLQFKTSMEKHVHFSDLDEIDFNLGALLAYYI